MKELKSLKTQLRIFSAIVLSLVIGVFLVLAWFVTQRLHFENNYYATDGKLDISSVNVRNAPAYLNGEWRSNRDGNVVKFPLSSITQAQRNDSYTLQFKLSDTGAETLYVHIPNYDGEVKIYLNGKEMESLTVNRKWVVHSVREGLYPLKPLKDMEQWQELTIEGDFSGQETTLYKRPVILGTWQDIVTLTLFESSNEMFLIGILLLVLVNGFVFMLFRPSHMMITLMTLFDTTIMLRTMLSMNYVVAMVKSIFPGAYITDSFRVQAQLFVLMWGGVIGCFLAIQIFDPERKAPQWLVVPCPIIYAVFSIVFPLNLELFEKAGRIALYAVYIITFIGVTWEFTIRWKKKKKKKYYAFQFVKTMYIGCFVFLDILLWTRYFDFMLLFYAYALFFVMHVIIRLYDNNESYQDVEVLNRNLELMNKSLETTVEERTKELSRANQILSELSIRDPLTHLHNRMYFEDVMEEAFDTFQKEGGSIYLCMFDLDYFKRINDCFGHDVGDEQLRFIAATVTEIVKEDAVVARIGGEEFVLLFQRKTADQVMKTVRKVHAAIAQDARRNERHTTASFGVASLKEGETIKQMMKNADLALYEAKDNGRNRIVSYLE